MTDRRTGKVSNCAAVDGRLDDWLDGGLDDRARREVEAHLDVCPDCRALARDLEALRAASADLPRSILPEQDLWPGIRGALTSDRTHDRVVRFPRIGAGLGLLRRAASILALIGVGAAAAYLGLRGAPPSPEGKGSPVAPEAVSFATLGPAFETVRAEILRAKETLHLALQQPEHRLDPATQEVLDRNLAIIDDAIAEIEDALRRDPGNPDLEHLLLANHQLELSILRRYAELSG